MKKLLAVALVACLASVANAGLTYSVNGNEAQPLTTVMPGLVTIELSNGTAGTGLYDGGFFVLKGGASFVSGSVTAVMPGTWSIVDLGVMEDFGGQVYAVNWDAPSVSPFAAGKMFDFAVNMTDGSSIDALDYSAAPLFTVNAIPEPATMALLGLGGLLFARKK